MNTGTGQEAGGGLDLGAGLDIDALMSPVVSQTPPGQAIPKGNGDGAGNPPPADKVTETPAALPAIPKDVIEAHLKAKGIEKALPENITLDDLAELVGPKTGPKLHPQALAIQKALESGQTLEQYLEQRAEPQRMLKLDDDQLFTAALRQRFGKSEANPDGWSDEKIGEVVSAKRTTGDLALQAEQIRMTLRDHIKKQQAEDAAIAKEFDEPEAPNFTDPEVVKNFKEAIVATSKEVVKDGKLFGIDVAGLVKPEDLASRLESLLMPDPKTGLSVTQARLQGNNAWAQMALAMDLLQSGALASLLKGNVEQAKKDLMDQLDLNPSASGNAGRVKEGAIDIDQLLAPTALHSSK